MSNYKVIKAFNIPIEIETLQEIEITHSYISDKLILDAVNGVNVVARDFHEVNKSRQSFTNRAIDSLLGNSKRRQDLINENIIEGLNACTHWLRDHDRHISRIDNKIGIIANEISRTQDEILKFYSQHQRLKNNFEQLRETFYEFEQSTNEKFKYLNEYIKSIDIRTKAMDLIDFEFSKLNADKYSHLPIPLQIYTLLDNIKTGDGGIYYDCLENQKAKKDFQEKIENDLIGYYKNKCNLKNIIDYDDLLIDVNKLSITEKQALSFISTQQYNTMLEKRFYPEVSDLISIISTFDCNVAKEEIEKQSNIKTFFVYDDYIRTSLNEHLKV